MSKKIKKRNETNNPDTRLVVETNRDKALSPAKFGVKGEEFKEWFRNVHAGITTPLAEKTNIPKGVWTKCKDCGQIFANEELAENLFVCPSCNHHHRIAGIEYMKLLFDKSDYKLLFENIKPVDMLHFKDVVAYEARIKEAQQKTKLLDAMSVATGKIGGHQAVLAAMEFDFIGGSLGCVVGEKFCLAVEYAIKKKLPFICVTQSGGARMMESAFSLMQMPKTVAMLHLLAQKKLPYIVVLTDPTYGGVTASFAMLGDVHLAEPKARIGFAGPRVIEELIKQKLPEGFQTSESLKDNGFVDRIVHRHQLKMEITNLLFFFKH